MKKTVVKKVAVVMGIITSFTSACLIINAIIEKKMVYMRKNFITLAKKMAEEDY